MENDEKVREKLTALINSYNPNNDNPKLSELSKFKDLILEMEKKGIPKLTQVKLLNQAGVKVSRPSLIKFHKQKFMCGPMECGCGPWSSGSDEPADDEAESGESEGSDE